MRPFYLAICLCFSASLAAAADAPGNGFLISGASAPLQRFAEWDNGKGAQIARGQKDIAKAPPTASRYTEKKYEFPSGIIRVLEFKKATGGAMRAIGQETTLFVVAGDVSVGVAGNTVDLKAGDVVNSPSGVLRGTGDATVVLWTVTGTVPRDAAKPAVVRGADLQESLSLQWTTRDGKAMTVDSKDAKDPPADATQMYVKRYIYDGNSVRLVRLKKGVSSPENHDIDALLYVIKGHLRRIVGDKTADVVAGDAIIEATNTPGYWDALEDSVFVITSSAAAAAPSKP